MKKQIILFVAIMCNIGGFAQFTDVIPSWVKDVTTPEEYKVWEEVVKNYQINFENSPLLKSKKAHDDAEARAKGYASLKELAAHKPENSLPGVKAKFFESFDRYRTIVPEVKDEIGKGKLMTAIVYSSLDGYDVHLRVSANYFGEDKARSVISNPRLEVESLSGLKAEFDSKIFTFALTPDKTCFHSNIGGFLKFTTPKGEEKQEYVNIIVTFKDE